MIIFWLIVFAYAAISVYFFNRIERVHKFRMDLMRRDFDRFNDLSSFNLMVACFWKPLRRNYWISAVADARYDMIQKINKEYGHILRGEGCKIIPAKCPRNK